MTENREPRRVLDTFWDGGFVDEVLEQGLWNIAIRTAQIDYAPSITPAFGYRRAFSKPDDYIRTAGLATDEYFNNPLTAYNDEANYIFADHDTLYLRYVSNDASYGGDLSKWPESMSGFAACALAVKACKRLTQSAADLEALKADCKKLLTEARGRDAMNEATAFLPRGSWTTSRGSKIQRTDRFDTGWS